MEEEVKQLKAKKSEPAKSNADTNTGTSAGKGRGKGKADDKDAGKDAAKKEKSEKKEPAKKAAPVEDPFAAWENASAKHDAERGENFAERAMGTGHASTRASAARQYEAQNTAAESRRGYRIRRRRAVAAGSRLR